MAQETKQVPLSQLRESPGNPRKLFGDLAGLAASIKAQGILQPLVAREVDGHLELVFGHRRFRAAKLAGLKSVPVVVRALGDIEVAEAQLVENLQREDVHPLELASGYRALMDRGLKAEQVASRVGVSESSVYAALKLLDLVPEAQKAFLSGRLEAAHARAVARVKGERLQLAALRDVEALEAKRGTKASVKAVEKLVQARYMGERSKAEKKRRASTAAPSASSAALRARRDELLAARVADLLERKRSLEDVDLRVLLLAATTTSDAAQDVLVAQGVRSDRLAKVAGPRLRGLLVRALLLPWLRASDDAAGAVARAYGLGLREIEATAQALLAADGLVGP